MRSEIVLCIWWSSRLYALLLFHCRRIISRFQLNHIWSDEGYRLNGRILRRHRRHSTCNLLLCGGSRNAQSFSIKSSISLTLILGEMQATHDPNRAAGKGNRPYCRLQPKVGEHCKSRQYVPERLNVLSMHHVNPFRYIPVGSGSSNALMIRLMNLLHENRCRSVGLWFERSVHDNKR